MTLRNKKPANKPTSRERERSAAAAPASYSQQLSLHEIKARKHLSAAIIPSSALNRKIKVETSSSSSTRARNSDNKFAPSNGKLDPLVTQFTQVLKVENVMFVCVCEYFKLMNQEKNVPRASQLLKKRLQTNYRSTRQSKNSSKNIYS
jgi:hypothetical protein